MILLRYFIFGIFVAGSVFAVPSWFFMAYHWAYFGAGFRAESQRGWLRGAGLSQWAALIDPRFSASTRTHGRRALYGVAAFLGSIAAIAASGWLLRFV